MSTWIVRFGVFFFFIFFSFFPLSFRFVLFVSLFLSKDARSCSNLFSRLTFSGLSSTGRASKGAKKNPSKDEPPPGRPVGRSSRAARGNVHRCWRVRPGARGGAPAGFESCRSAQRPRGAGAGSDPAPDGAGGEGGRVPEDLKASVASSVSLQYPMCKCCTSVYYAHKHFFEYDRTDLITSQV